MKFYIDRSDGCALHLMHHDEKVLNKIKDMFEAPHDVEYIFISDSKHDKNHTIIDPYYTKFNKVITEFRHELDQVEYGLYKSKQMIEMYHYGTKMSIIEIDQFLRSHTCGQDDLYRYDFPEDEEIFGASMSVLG